MNRSKSIFIFQILWIVLSAVQTTFAQTPSRPKPNIIYILTDQWRASATGYSGDPNVKTPNIDALAKGSLNFKNAVSITPVCTPYRAALMTGRYPTTTWMFFNDVKLFRHHDFPGRIFGRGACPTWKLL